MMANPATTMSQYSWIGSNYVLTILTFDHLVK